MQKLEAYLDKFDNGTLEKDIYDKYKDFDYKYENIYKHHLDFMLTNLYNIRLVEPKKIRMNQQEFRKAIREKFNGQCIITGQTCLDELTAAHIVPISDEENYDINNGLLLQENIHRTFDKYKWSINPNTLLIEINENENIGSIRKYVGNTIKLKMNEHLFNNLECHYKAFLQKVDNYT